jgi:hypothetical protein
LEATTRRLRSHICSGEELQGRLRLGVEALLIGVSILGLPVPGAYAQSGAEAIAQPGMESPGHYLVTFHLDQATLTEQNREVIAQAAEYYRRGGTPQAAGAQTRRGDAPNVGRRDNLSLGLGADDEFCAVAGVQLAENAPNEHLTVPSRMPSVR